MKHRGYFFISSISLKVSGQLHSLVYVFSLRPLTVTMTNSQISFAPIHTLDAKHRVRVTSCEDKLTATDSFCLGQDLNHEAGQNLPSAAHLPSCSIKKKKGYPHEPQADGNDRDLEGEKKGVSDDQNNDLWFNTAISVVKKKGGYNLDFLIV